MYLPFDMPVAYQVCSVDDCDLDQVIGACVLLSGVVFQISGY
jgi:hypothetical protein